MKSVGSKNAFTIVELLVAMALVVILVALSSVIFATAVKAHRTADSTVEITRRAEVISRQLVNDVRRLQIDAPVAIWFEYDATTGKRFDQILFFANGNFQTIRQYNGRIVSGNLARVQYGHAWQIQAAPIDYRQSNLLSRRVHLLTSDLSLTNFPDPAQFVATFSRLSNNLLEYDRISLSEWKNVVQTQINCNQFLSVCFDNGTDLSNTGRSVIDMRNIDTLHLLLSENISEFKVQWAFKSEDILHPLTGEPFLPNELFSGLRWWPDADYGDFAASGMDRSLFGIHFNLPGGETLPDWFSAAACRTLTHLFTPIFMPRAFKFTFTVHDTKGLFPEGRTFTQIVYINSH